MQCVVSKFVTLSIIFMTYLLDFAQYCIDELLVLQCVLIVLILLQFGLFMLSLSDNNQAGVIEAFISI